MLRIWDINTATKTMVGHVNVDWPARSVAWHPSGLYLAVGLFETVKGGHSGGGKGGTKKKGTVKFV